MFDNYHVSENCYNIHKQEQCTFYISLVTLTGCWVYVG